MIELQWSAQPCATDTVLSHGTVAITLRHRNRATLRKQSLSFLTLRRHRAFRGRVESDDV